MLISAGHLRCKSLEKAKAFRVLTDEAGDRAPVPERPTREKAAVGHRLVVVDDDGARDVPALPAGLARAVGEVDVLAVEVVALVEPAELLEHLPSQEQERAQEPFGRRGLVGLLVEQVM